MNIYDAMNLAYEHRESAPTDDDLEHDEDVARASTILKESPEQIAETVEIEDGVVWPIHMAATMHLPGIVKALLDAGADVNQPSEVGGLSLTYRGATPFLCALDQDDLAIQPRLFRIVEILLERGGNPSLADKNGWSPAKIAAGLRKVRKGSDLYKLRALIQGKTKKK